MNKFNKELSFKRKILFYGLSLATIASLTFAINQILIENVDTSFAQTEQNQPSIQHNAKGHESHQVIIFQNPNDNTTYVGVVTFTLSKLADVIAFDEITGKENTNATKKIWEVGDKKFVPNTLLKNATEGSVNFNGSGILAHRTLGDTFTGNYTLNDTATNNTSSNQ